GDPFGGGEGAVHVLLGGGDADAVVDVDHGELRGSGKKGSRLAACMMRSQMAACQPPSPAPPPRPRSSRSTSSRPATVRYPASRSGAGRGQRAWAGSSATASQPGSPWWGDGRNRGSWPSAARSSGSVIRWSDGPKPAHRGRGGASRRLTMANRRRRTRKRGR